MSAPAFSCVAIRIMTKMELELITEPDMYIFFEKVRDVEFPIFLIDIVKPAISI